MSLSPPAARPDDVLRYWLGAVRLEESLKVRPRARRANYPAGAPRLDAPARGQEYFKLPLADLAAPLGQDDALRRPLDGELSAFFESWLHAQYGRTRDETELSHLLCFPVVHLPRGELAGLLRCGVRLRFGSSEGSAFRVPTHAERQRRAYPPPPTEVRITRAPRSEGTWPFFIDTRLLSHPLGIASEAIDALFEALRACDVVGEAQMLALVAATLEAEAADTTTTAPVARRAEDDVAAQLTRLQSAMQALLARSATRATVYPVGIVIDGTQAKTTWHLQRELASLIEAPREDVRARRCLAAYLTRTPVDADTQPQRALFHAPALTETQRRAAEQFWGSTLTSVQGPPGTGKTTLILHLCAEALVRQVDDLLDAQIMGSELLVIASSNNRAVDNVIDPLCANQQLPLALRVGSRPVCEQTLSACLRQTMNWLRKAQSAPAALRTQALAEALERFASVRGRLDEVLAPRRAARAYTATRVRLEQALATLPTTTGAAASAPQLSVAVARALDKPLKKLERRLAMLSEMCTVKPSMAQVNAVARHYERTAKVDLPALEAVLRDAGIAFDVPLPPLAAPLDVSALMETWEEGAESFLAQLADLRERVAPVLVGAVGVEKARQLRAELDALGAAPDAPPPAGGHDALSSELFAAALSVREAWARTHASALQDAVAAALEAAERELSLRPFFRSEPERAKLFCRLFCVWGSTLLSLGNCLPPEPDCIARVVIDEAGQCHPAHAVAALMRSSAAMIIGDVFQLTPVIGLTTDDEARLVRSLRPPVNAATLLPFRVSSESHVSAQSLADQATRTRHALVDHFRCHAEIIAVSDALCAYGLRVHTPSADSGAAASFLAHPVSMRDLRGTQERLLGSLWNELEHDETLRLVAALLGRGAAPADIAVITPYRGQLERLRRGLLSQRVPLEFSPERLEGEQPIARGGSGLALGTVHRFQGGERPIVLFSSVVTELRSLPFLNTRPNLLNVAVSRAQRHFVCLGDRRVLLQGTLTRKLAEAAHPLDAL